MNLDTLFSEEGLLAEKIPYFRARAGQQNLAAQVLQAISQQTHLLAEAGTGTGKTFAYLAPALLSDKIVLISTATKTLQDQIFTKDLPLLQKILGKPTQVSVLKGRQNYICLFHLERNAQQGLFYSQEEVKEYAHIREQVPFLKTGEVSEISDVSEGSAIWSQVTSTKENCLQQECPHYQKCFLIKARKKALQSKIVIVNHHLLFADVFLKNENLGELLPKASVVIIDEAHPLPEIASRFLGISFSSREMLTLLNQIETEQILQAKDMKDLQKSLLHLHTALKELRLSLGENAQRQSFSVLQKNKEAQKALETLQISLSLLLDNLELAKDRSKLFAQLYEELQELNLRFSQILTADDKEAVFWFETFSQSFSFHHTPLSVAKEFQNIVQELGAAFIFVSATLSINQDFKHFKKQLGFEDKCITELRVPSPFDYEKQTLFYLPRGLPDPNDFQYHLSVFKAAMPVIEACGGKTFFLLTSHHAIETLYQLFAPDFPYPILKQGDKPKDQLLQEFRELGNAVLLATSSFWEGVDVRGEALSCVIIDKLPFSPPDDPVFQAKSELLRKQGKNPFFDFQLPQAIIALNQGVGRLIRSDEDKGVIMICDPRLIAREYGQLIISSLPPFKRTRELHKVQAFFVKHKTHEHISA